MKTSKHCRGCYYDRYTQPGTCERPGIDSTVTSKQCWSLADAVLKTRFAISVNAPMGSRRNYIKVKVPSCYTQQGTCYLDGIPEYAK